MSRTLSADCPNIVGILCEHCAHSPTLLPVPPLRRRAGPRVPRCATSRLSRQRRRARSASFVGMRWPRPRAGPPSPSEPSARPCRPSARTGNRIASVAPIENLGQNTDAPELDAARRSPARTPPCGHVSPRLRPRTLALRGHARAFRFAVLNSEPAGSLPLKARRASPRATLLCYRVSMANDGGKLSRPSPSRYRQSTANPPLH